MVEQQAGTSATLSEQLLDESPDALMTITLEGRILFWNRGAESIFGYLRQEAIGMLMDELIVPPAQRSEWQGLLAQTAQYGTAAIQTVRRHKDGAQVCVDVSMRRVELPGLAPCIVVSKKDVTILKQLEAQQAIDAKFQGLLEAAPDAKVIVGTGGIIQLVNGQAERLFGYPRHELIGRSIDILVPPRHRGRHLEHHNRYFADPQTRPMGSGLNLQALRKDGSEFPAEISLAPMHSQGTTLVTAAIRDVTERRLLESRIREASRLKSEFLANMSHELRTPLNAIIGFTELMYKGKVGPLSATHHEYLGDILTSAKHLLQLVNEVLDLSKVEAGKMELRPETVDLLHLIREVRDILRGLAANKRLQVETHLDPSVSVAFVDPARLKQILYNYLSNAIKFTPDGGRVTIRVKPHGADLFRLDVTDSGIGIAPENLSKLFVEFQQLDAGTAKKYQGTGLGLSLTKRLVEAHGGRVEVRSTPGEGSTFSAILPLRMSDVESAAHPSSAPKVQ